MREQIKRINYLVPAVALVATLWSGVSAWAQEGTETTAPLAEADVSVVVTEDAPRQSETTAAQAVEEQTATESATTDSAEPAAVFAVDQADDAENTEIQEAATLSEQVADLKQELIGLNRDLFILEEDLLYPASTQLALFVSVDVGEYFALDAIEIRVDDKVVSSYLYTEREVKALHRGGIQRIYVGNVKVGEHRITAFFTGVGPAQERDYKRGATYVVNKGTDPTMVELRITDVESKNQPEFSIQEWQ